jgi:alpha-N-arabinofuranosidase
MHGYEVRLELERREVRDWAGISRPQIYYSIDKLARLGLIAQVETEGRSEGPERRVYRTSEEGLGLLAYALEREDWTNQRERPPFLAWLALSWRARPGVFAQQIARRQEFLRGELARERAVLRSIRKEVGHSFHEAVWMVTLVIQQFRVELRWLEKVSRRAFSSALLTVPFLARAQSKNSAARIKIDPDRTIGAIDQKIYGNFAEHLGRCIEGGIFDEGSPLSDAQGYRKDVIEAVKGLNVTLLRWPGGNFSSNYDWMDGIGPRGQRPKRLEMAWGTVEDNRFGTHEALGYCEMLGIEPYLCANFGTGSWVEAQRWVEYINSSADTAMTQLRAKNGRVKPWKVTYWGLGNEMDGPWQMGHRSAEDYGKFALEGAKLMKWTDPSLKLVAAGSSNFGPDADWTGWNRTVLDHLKHHIDYLSLHTYVGNQANDYYEFLASSLLLNDRTKTAEGTIREALSNEPASKKIYIAWDEWNVWYRARGEGKESGRRILEERYNLEDALVVATFLNTFINNAHIVKIANMAQIVNVIAPIFTSETGLFLQTIYYPLALFANNAKGVALEVFVDAPTYKSKTHDSVPYLDVSAARDGGTLVLSVVNRHREQAIDAEIEAEDSSFGGSYEVSEVSGPDIKAENNFDASPVKSVKKTITGNGSRMRYSFPPHSFTMIKGAIALA